MPGSPADGSTSRRPRVLLADDDARVSRAVLRLLSTSCDVVECVPDSPRLFEAVAELRPDVVILDFSLPGELNVVDVCHRLASVAPEVRVVAFTGSNDPELRRLALEAGASAFVWKLRAADDLLPTLRAVLASKR